MARRRMISPDIWQDPWFGKLSHTERIFYIGIISNCDDEGRILAESPYLRSRIFIYEDIPLDNIETMLQKFRATNPNFCLYSNNGTGNRYIALLSWSKYQKPEHASPSTLPPPPNTALNIIPHHSENDSPHHSENDSPPSIVKYSIVKDSIVKYSKKSTKQENTSKDKGVYGEFQNVYLTNDQHQRIISQFGEDGTKQRIEKLSCGIESKDYKYKNFYATILAWDKREKDIGNNISQDGKTQRQSQGRYSGMVKK